MARVNPLLDRIRTYPAAELERIRERVLARGIPLHDFSVGDPPDPTPSFVREACRAAITEVSRYPTVRGNASVREGICAYVHRRFGVTLDPERHVLPTSGSKEVVFHMPLLVVDPRAEDRLVVFPDPGYPAYARGALFAGGEPHPVSLSGDFVFRPWELPEAVLRRTRLLYLNSPHNPTGAESSREVLERSLELARTYDFLLVNDECYIDIYDRTPPTSLLEVGAASGMEGMLVLQSLSKRSGMTGYRWGLLAGDPAWIGRLVGFRANPGLVPPDFVNEAAVAALEDDRHVQRRRERWQARRAYMLDFLEDLGLEPLRTQTTFYVWFRAPAGMDDLTYAARLLEAGVVVTPGSMLGVAGAGRGWLRLALVPDLDGCRRAAEVWRRVHRDTALPSEYSPPGGA